MNFGKASRLVMLGAVLASGMSVTAKAGECVLAQDGDYNGAHFEYPVGTYVSNLLGWNDVVSSVWVKNGYLAVLHSDADYKGATFYLYGSGSTSTPRLGVHYYGDGVYYNLGDINWNDKLSSFSCEKA